MSKKHHTIYAIFGDEDLGKPLHRRRFMGCGLNAETMVWVGPQNQTDVTLHFLSYFQKKAALTSAVFAGLDTDENKERTRKLYAARSNVVYDPALATKDLLCQSAAANLDLCHDYMRRGKKVGHLPGVAADISQNPQFRHRAGPFVPTLQRSSNIVCITEEDHLYTSDELSYMHGWPTLASSHEHHKACLNYDLGATPLGNQQRILGDGMSCHAVQAWSLYVFSHSLRRDMVDRMTPELSLSFLIPMEEPRDGRASYRRAAAFAGADFSFVSDLED
jgi:hypothetical protein